MGQHVEEEARYALARAQSWDFPLQAWRIGVLTAFIGVWELSVGLGYVDKFFVSTPSAVLRFVVNALQTTLTWYHIAVTLREALLGFLLGGGTGIAVGLVLARFGRVDRVVDPYLTLLNAMPRIALAPLFMLWFGIGELSKVVLAGSIVFFVLEVNTRASIRMVDSDLITIARLMGARERQVFMQVILPAIVPTVFAGLRLGAIYSLLGAVVGEMIAAQSGLGQQLTFHGGLFETDAVMGLLLILALMALGLASATSVIERRLLHWQVVSSQTGTLY